MVTGDYAILGGEQAVTIERKSLQTGGGREHIQEHRYRSNVNPRAVLSSLAAWECKFDWPVVYEPTPESSAERVETWLFWVAYEITQRANDLLRGCLSEPAQPAQPQSKP
jgi:hypothetical protein